MAESGGHSPLEQFEIKTLVPLHAGDVSLSFTNSSAFMVLAVLLVSGLFILGMRRGAMVPGGACGFLGSCGAAVGVGIAFALILESTPLTPRARSLAQAATSAVLAEISGYEAARCCQRDCYLALAKAAELSRDLLPIPLKAEERVDCRRKPNPTSLSSPSSFWSPSEPTNQASPASKKTAAPTRASRSTCQFV